MEFQIALNTIILLMMVVFPGFLFRKFYFVGEFTKQFNQGTQFDKLVWNIFFSSISILATIFAIYLFKKATLLPLMESISYDSISKIIKPLQDSEIPDKEVLYQMYKDLIILVTLVYLLAAFLGMLCHQIVRTFGLDVLFPLFRFNNHWYYYINGGRILYNNKENRKRMFTYADVLCEEVGSTKLYSGILSQYVVNRENNQLESIYLTNATRYKRVLNEDGSTKNVETKEIPGNTFCVPYSRVLNLNLTYYYKPLDEFKNKRIGNIINNTLFVALLLLISTSLFFDLSNFGIYGLFDKIGYLFWGTFLAANVKILIATLFNLDVEKDGIEKAKKKDKLIGSLLIMSISGNWLCYIVEGGSFWIYVFVTVGISFGFMLIAGLFEAIIKTKKKSH